MWRRGANSAPSRATQACLGRGVEWGRAARRLRLLGPNAEGVGCGDGARTPHPPGPLRPVTGVALSGDGRRTVSASGDHTLKVWDVETGRELRTLQGHPDDVNGVALSGDGRRAVSASADTLKVWDVETGANSAPSRATQTMSMAWP